MIILDTDIFIDYFRGIEVAVDYIKGIPINERATTDITLMELFKGARNKEELENIDKFIKRNIFIVLPVSSSASRRAVQILRRYSLQKGLGLPDALIAAVTLSADGKLITGNKKHFEFIGGFKVDLPPYRKDIAKE
ncbi:MAG: type II toxin-antitoxin system VapC family toxin [Actinomycetota bacterium]|nr:type II toxin-antitoxin system VapC family toxin [Actinomycetota bacterium]